MDGLTLGMLAGLSFLPPVAFALWVRNHEEHQREPLPAVLGMFVYGGTLGVLSALVLSVFVGRSLAVDPTALLGLVVLAPLCEELAKGLGLGLVRGRILELEDGIIYGACIGLGFGATENFLYGLSSLQDDGLASAVVTIMLRVVSSALLHACSTALLGYGVGLAKLRRTGGLAALAPSYGIAVAMHAAYNFLVSRQFLLAFVVAVALVLVVFGALRRRIKQLDAQPRDVWVTVER